LRYFAPSPPLRGWISSYYLFEADLPAIEDVLRAESAQIRFMVAGSGSYRFGRAEPVPVPRAGLSGPTNAATGFSARGPLRIFGAGLLPAGWAALIGAHAHQLADRVADLESMAGPVAGRTLERLVEARTEQEMIAAADAFFLLLSMKAKPPPLWFTRATDAWLTDKVNPQVGDLLDATGMSARQVERLALKLYGAPPKGLARKYRALRSAVRLGLQPEAGWEAAASGAFYDQSHFIRDFRRYVGMTPSQFVDHESPWLARFTMARREALPNLPRLTLVS
jgi:AraC-like DNA-binding protein